MKLDGGRRGCDDGPLRMSDRRGAAGFAGRIFGQDWKWFEPERVRPEELSRRLPAENPGE